MDILTNKQTNYIIYKHITRINLKNQNKIENQSKTKNYLAKERRKKTKLNGQKT
jgi:hypothetical protein